MENWDTFISHAGEDKDTVARPLAERLTKLGLRVWFDENELSIGDSLSRSIDKGLSHSNCGIVVLSPDFFKKDWPDYELRGLVAKSIGKKRTIYPLWHNVTREEVLDYSPSLADIFAENTSQSLDKIATKLVSAIRPDLHNKILRMNAYNNIKANSVLTREDPKKLHLSPVRHETLPEHFIHRVYLVKNVLFDVYPISVNDWVDGFQRDLVPSSELKTWESIAARYLRVCETMILKKKNKQHLYLSLLLSSMQMYEESIQQLQNFKPKQIKTIIDVLSKHLSVFSKIDVVDIQERDQANSLEKEAFFGDEVRIEEAYVASLSNVLNQGQAYEN